MIPLTVRNTSPMLAKPAPGADAADRLARITATTGWSYEIKFDGYRCLAIVENGKARLISRTGSDLTAKHPAVARALENTFGSPAVTSRIVPGRADLMLDGELVCLAADGSMTFAEVAKNGSRSVFMAFDVLYSGVDTRRLPYQDRMLALDDLGAMMVQEAIGGQHLFRAVTSLNGEHLWKVALEYGMEGVVAKRLTSPYLGGRRSDAWLKIKAKQTISALVTDLQPGEGSRASTFGALVVSLLDKGDWVEVGTVGSGFKDRDFPELIAAITAQGPVIVEVEFLAFTKDGRLREPVFKGIRTDVEVEFCNMAQVSQ